MLIPSFALSIENIFKIEFESGKLSTLVNNSILRGDRDVYYFNALSGQRLSTALTALEDNAVLAIYYRKNSKWILVDSSLKSRVWHGKLPKSQSNRYMIEVGGTRGNATYELFIGIAVVSY